MCFWREKQKIVVLTKMRSFVVIALIVSVCSASPIFIIEQPSQTPYAHPGVLVNSAMEDALPDELKNDFYKDPRIAAALAKESWVTAKETQVICYSKHVFVFRNRLFFIDRRRRWSIARPTRYRERRSSTSFTTPDLPGDEVSSGNGDSRVYHRNAFVSSSVQSRAKNHQTLGLKNCDSPDVAEHSEHIFIKIATFFSPSQSFFYEEAKIYIFHYIL